jgi:hypothetical protein
MHLTASADTASVNSDDRDRPDLLRLWLEFDVSDHEPEPLPADRIQLDGGDVVWRAFGRGVGVTGYDEADCLQLVTEAYRLPVPLITVCIADVTIAMLEERSLPAAAAVRIQSVMVWRGVWYPSPNMRRGPIPLA